MNPEERQSRNGLPRARISYSVVLVAGIGTASDISGLVSGWLSLFATLTVFVLFLVELCLLPSRFRRHRWGAFLPLLVCLVSVPLGSVAGHALFRARFHYYRERYDAIATGVRDGTYVLPLHGADTGLALSAHPVPEVGNVRAVEFFAVSHGFAGHKAYLRAFDEAFERKLTSGAPERWRYVTPLASGWYIVGD